MIRYLHQKAGHWAATVVSVAALIGPAASPATGQVAHAGLWPAAQSPTAITDAATERRISVLLAKMSLEEKVGQTIQGDIASVTPDDLKAYPLGSLLAGGNAGPGGDNRAPAEAWLHLITSYKTIAKVPRNGHEAIPLVFGIDAVHGHNKITGATIFPHNIGLGAAHDPDLIRRIGAVTAEEVKVTGADWTFGPTVAVPRDVRWGRSYEGYSEDPSIVAAYAGPMTLGLQGGLVQGRPLSERHIIGSAKHFLADGGTVGGVDQGDARLPELDLIRLHAQGYPPAIDAGILTVMASFSSWNGVKHTGNLSLLTDVLKGRMGFQGFVVGDWNAHGQVAGCTITDCPQALNAGIDMYMAPDSWRGLYDNTLAEVKSGVIPMSRLDDAVRRILRAKFKAGLDGPVSQLTGKFDRLGSPDHRAIAREAVRKSLVLLKNNGHVLPIRADAHVLVAGDGADNIGKQSGGWTLNWQGQGNVNRDFPHGQSIFAGIAEALTAGHGEAELSVDGRWRKRPDVAIVVFGEDPYAEFQGDIASLEYQPGDKKDLALLTRLKAQHIPVVAVFLSGRPLWTNPEINQSDAFVAAWLPGTEGGGVADVLVAKPDGRPRYDFHGRLSYSWPSHADRSAGHRDEAGYNPQFKFGYGLTYAERANLPTLSEDPGQRAAPINLEQYFVAGHFLAPWSETRSGAVTLVPVDAGAQENARRAEWSGPGELSIIGQKTDLTRQATGDMALMIRFRVETPPTGKVALSFGCGAHCGAAVDFTPLLADAKAKEWRVAKVKLTCFRDQGADVSAVTSPFTLQTDGRLTLVFSEIRLAPNEGDAVCPGRASPH